MSIEALAITHSLLNGEPVDVASSCCIRHLVCQDTIIKVARKLDYPFSSADIVEKYPRFKANYVRNVLRTMKAGGIIIQRTHSNHVYYILPEWKSRFHMPRTIHYPMGVTMQHTPSPLNKFGKPKHRRKRVMEDDTSGGIDFYRFLDSLDWGDICIHNVRFEFVTSRFGFISGDSWSYEKVSHSWVKKAKGTCFDFTVICYDSGKVQVAIACTLHPVELSVDGLIELTSFVGEVKGNLGSDVPSIDDWVVTQWHYGRDSIKEVSGFSFNVTFNTWSGCLARIYAKHELNKVRMEVIQSPKRKLADLLEEKLLNEKEEDFYYYQPNISRLN